MEEGVAGYSRVYTNRMSAGERWKASAAQLVYSPVARFYYWFMCALTIFEMAVTVVDAEHAPETTWFLCLELIMVTLLMSEVALRLLADGPVAFFRSFSSLFDLAVASACLWVAVFLFVAPGLLHRVQRWVPVTMLRVRDSLRLLRLIFLIKNTRKSQQLQGSMMQLRLDENDDETAHHFAPIDSPGSHAMDANDLAFGTPFAASLVSPKNGPLMSPPMTFGDSAIPAVVSPNQAPVSPLLPFNPPSPTPPRPLTGLRSVNVSR